MTKEEIKDILARVREIKYHHTMPRKSRHGNTTRICEDIESRISIVLKQADEQAAKIKQLRADLAKTDELLWDYVEKARIAETEYEKAKAELDKHERKIENMYHAISGIQNDDYRIQVNDDTEARQKEDARTVEPMFKTTLPEKEGE